ncbi:hypothetical protein [Streptomyces sp. NPDC059894]|uniref:hypothetical protein n=1 Tax=unclassified Streptomyces TaxID=2593676 RepID=UPI00365F8768
MDIGTALLAAGMIVIEAALWTHSASLFIVGTVFAGAAVGTLFRHGLSVTDVLVGLALGRRTESTSTPDTFSGPSTHLAPVEENHE